MEEPKPIERALFRETEDGRTVYFPWGLTGRGFRLTEERTKKSALRAASLLLGSVLAIAAWTAQVLQPLTGPEAEPFSSVAPSLAGPLAALFVVLIGYYLWTSRLVESLPETSFQVSRDERLREAAKLVRPWKITAIGLITIVMSGLVIWLDAGVLWLGLAGLFVGIGLIWWSLQLKRVLNEES